MEIKKYNQNIQDLYHKQQEYLQLLDPRVLGVLNTLLKEAKKLKDEELIGYTYHSLAFVEYFVFGHYELFLKYLRKAIDHLLKVENSPELMHVFNLIAVDGFNKGIYDLSYRYLINARNIATRTKQFTSAAILEENIAHLLMLIGNYQEARKFLKRSLKTILKNPSHIHYFSNVTSCYFNDIFCCLELNLLDEAQENNKKVKEFMDKHPDSFHLDTYINFSLYNARLAAKLNDKQAIEKHIHDLLKHLKKVSQLTNYIKDLYTLTNDLLAIQEYELAGKIVKSISKRELTKDAPSAQRTLIKTKIAYYQAIQNKNKLFEAYLEQDRLLNRKTIEQKESNIFRQALITLTSELQKQYIISNKTRKELEVASNTDALTGLSNRLKINTSIDKAFENSYHNQTYFGIGVLDLDNLKIYNDTYGHTAGDELLIRAAKALEKLEDNPKIEVSRYGGDEFVLLFKNMTNQEIKDAINHMEIDETIHYSIGICNDIAKEKQKPWDYLMIADEQLYAMKTKKRNNKRIKGLSIQKYKDR